MTFLPNTLLLALLSSTAVAADTLPAPASPVAATQLAQLAAGLLFVIFLIFLGAYLLKRFGVAGGSVNGCLKVVSAMSLGSRDKIVLIQAGKDQVLIGVSPGRLQTLHVLSEPVEPIENKGFAGQLSKAVKKQEAPCDD